MQERFARKNEVVELRRAFDLLDSRKDGHIDAEELGEFFQRLGHKLKKVLFLQHAHSRSCLQTMFWKKSADMS